MNAPAKIEARTPAMAIEAANAWVNTARPIIKAWFQLDEAHLHVSRARLSDPKGFAAYHKMSPAARTWEEAQSLIDKCRAELFEMLGGIRDNFICDERMEGPSIDEPEGAAEQRAWDNAWSDSEEFNDEIERGCMSVDAAIRIVEIEE
jgi:hypothetical protein